MELYRLFCWEIAIGIGWNRIEWTSSHSLLYLYFIYNLHLGLVLLFGKPRNDEGTIILEIINLMDLYGIRWLHSTLYLNVPPISIPDFFFFQGDFKGCNSMWSKVVNVAGLAQNVRRSDGWIRLRKEGTTWSKFLSLLSIWG